LGYKTALEKKGIKVNEDFIKYGNFLGDMAENLARELILELKCDSIFVTNNIILLRVLSAIKKLGLRIPQDIGLASFDDLEWMEYCSPSITAVAQPTYEIGITAMS